MDNGRDRRLAPAGRMFCRRFRTPDARSIRDLLDPKRDDRPGDDHSGRDAE
jgi:hypothetical protein